MTDTIRPEALDATPPAVPAPPSGLAPQHRTALVLLLAAVFVVLLNETMMGVALPRIQEELHVDATAGQWVTSAFALAMAVVIPTTGWLITRLTTRRLFVLAMAAFSAGTLVAALAPVFGVLIAGRVVQGAGTAIMMPLMMTTVMAVTPPSDRGRIMGRVSLVMSVAPAIGPVVSGALVQVLPWQAPFWVTLPIAVAMLIVGIRLVPDVSEPRALRLDVPSVVLSGAASAALVLGLGEIGVAARGASGLPPWIPIAVGVVALVLFIRRQIVLQRTDEALLDLRTFRSRGFTLALALMATAMVAMFGSVIVLPQLARYVLGLDPVWIGVILLPGGLLMGAAGPLIGRLSDRFGPRPLMICGAVGLSAAMWFLALGVGAGSSPVALLGANIVLMLSLSLLFTPAFSASLGSLPPRLYSHGSATIGTVQQVAGAAGTSVFVALFASGLASSGAAVAAVPTAVQAAAGAHLAYLGGGILSLGVIVIALFIRRPADVG
jgi:MFS transporter, DHA2 family, lincomycin resistance protein